MVSYAGLLRLLAQKGLSQSALARQAGISSRTMAKIARKEKIANHVLKKMAAVLDCSISDLYTEISENALLQRLRDEKKARISGGLYQELQILMAYHSNKMEGSHLDQKQIRQIFETKTIAICQDSQSLSQEFIPVDDLIEMINHFRAFDFILDMAEKPLDEAMIKEIHRILLQGTLKTDSKWFALGEYKKAANMIDERKTASPEQVPALMKALLKNYNALSSVSLEDIVRFHAEFEQIHPFQDGNGRVGRLIAFKECLHHNLTPFIIKDSKKALYYQGLRKWKEESSSLIEIFQDGQNTMKALMEFFGLDTDPQVDS